VLTSSRRGAERARPMPTIHDFSSAAGIGSTFYQTIG
jgi:hypothetical protein